MCLHIGFRSRLRFRPYLCSMKVSILVTFIIIVSTSALPCKAQFYTIGTATQQRATQTENPSEQPSVTPRDSIVLTDSLKTEGMKQVTYDESLPLVSLPLKQIKIGSKFGMRMHPIYHKNMMHNGVDLSANYDVVYSMFPGRVVRIGYDNRSGNFVTVQSGSFTVSYCHLSKVYVHQNDYVEAGTPICRSGNTGASTGPHLHLTTKKDGKAINPVILLNYIQDIKDN